MGKRLQCNKRSLRCKKTNFALQRLVSAALVPGEKTCCCGALFCKTDTFSTSHIACSGHSWPYSQRDPKGFPVSGEIRKGPLATMNQHTPAIMVPWGGPEGSGGVPRDPDGAHKHSKTKKRKNIAMQKNMGFQNPLLAKPPSLRH